MLIAGLLLAASRAASAAALPLPGYSASGAEIPADRRAAARPGENAFPSAEKLFGAAADPLDALAAGDEDLRDAVAAQPSAAALKAALRSPSPAARLAAVRAAGYPRDVEAVPHLAGAMLRLDEPASVRGAAALSLGRIGDRVAVKALAEALRDPAPEVRYAAALSLGHLPADGVATRLERVLREDPVWQPRYAAAIALGRARKAFAAFPLAEALASDPAWQVRQQAARSLKDLGTKHALAALAEGLKDRDPAVRQIVRLLLDEN